MNDPKGTVDETDEIIREFLVESHENLAQLDLDLVELEKSPADVERLRSVFRAVHTMKGVSGFLGFGHLEKVTHAGEDLLGKLRDNELAMSTEIGTALFAAVDTVRGILAHIEADGTEGERDDTALVARLSELASGQRPPAGSGPKTDAQSPVVPVASGPEKTSVDGVSKAPGSPSSKDQDLGGTTTSTAPVAGSALRGPRQDLDLSDKQASTSSPGGRRGAKASQSDRPAAQATKAAPDKPATSPVPRVPTAPGEHASD